MVAKMKLVDNVVRSFKVAKVFRENTDKINSFDFSPAGDYIISCSEDDQIVIYDSQKGELSKTINSKKYGVDLIHFAHTKTTAIHSSTKVDDTIRYNNVAASQPAPYSLCLAYLSYILTNYYALLDCIRQRAIA